MLAEQSELAKYPNAKQSITQNSELSIATRHKLAEPKVYFKGSKPCMPTATCDVSRNTSTPGEKSLSFKVAHAEVTVAIYMIYLLVTLNLSLS